MSQEPLDLRSPGTITRTQLRQYVQQSSPDQQDKVRAVMREFDRGTLQNGSGQTVQSRNQAVAMALSEAGLARTS